MRRLIWLAEVPWLGLPQRHHHLIAALRHDWSVLFVEPPRPLAPPRLTIHRDDGIEIAQVAPILNARPPLAQRVLARPAARRLAAALAAWQLRNTTRLAGITGTDDLAIVCSSIYLIHAAVRLRPRLLITDLCDDHRYFTGAPPWADELHWTAVRSADLVTTSSLALQADLNARFPGKVRYLSNGTPAGFLDLAGNAAQAPTPLVPGEAASGSETNKANVPPAGRGRDTGGGEGSSRPTVGFVGAISDWFDFDLLDEAARALPDRDFLLAGPIDPSVAESAQRLAQLPNVTFPGTVPSPAVPALISRFAVGIIPFRLTALTRAVNPNKLYEYAARDIPIVCTAFSPDVERFRGAVDICDTAAGFARILRERTAGHNCPSTRWIAEAHTWERLGEAFATLIFDRFTARHRSRPDRS